eukprot:c20696_g1_i1.p1 GENE.c20696_g1_i1~~c20696_g1_i1.p1  ORF type:complete len:1168 (+),score=224.64 c20696_g1_i1:422-3505(+)
MTDNSGGTRFVRATRTVTLAVSVTETVDLSVVRFAGLPQSGVRLSPTGQSNTFNIALTISTSTQIPEGPVQFNIVVSDPAGNTATVQDVTSGSVSIVDRIAPTATVFCVQSSNANRQFAKVGDVVRLQVVANEVVNVASIFCPTKAQISTPASSFPLTVAITTQPNGPLTCTPDLLRDLAGNSGVYTFVQCNVTVDTQAPAVTLATISSNAISRSRARAGSDVTVQIQANEPFTVKSATIAGVAASRNTIVSQTDARISGLVPASVLDNQPVGFTIQISDLAGNERTVTTTTDSSAVTVDLTPPTAQICYSSTTTPGFAKNESRVHVVFTPSESVEATFQCLGVSRTFSAANSFSFDHTVVVPRPITQPFSCTVDYHDLVSNTGSPPTIGASSCEVTIDTVAPRVVSVTMRSSNSDPNAARIGDEVTATVEANKDISDIRPFGDSAPLWTKNVRGRIATLTLNVGAASFSRDFATAEFSAQVFDLANNAINVTDTNSSSQVAIIVQKPLVAMQIIPSRHFLPGENIQVRVSTTSRITNVLFAFNGRVINEPTEINPGSPVSFRFTARDNEPTTNVGQVRYTEFSTGANISAAQTFVTISTCEVGFAKDRTNFCVRVACPASSSGANCQCNFGFSGTLSWNGTAWTGSCQACGTGEVSRGADQCAANIQDAGTIATTTQCEAVPCPPHSSAPSRGECLCNSKEGRTGELLFQSPNWVGTCRPCSTCSFLQYELEACQSTRDRKCSSITSTLAPLIVAVLLWFFSIGLVLMLRPLSMEKSELAIVIATALLGFLDVCSDVGFVLFDASGGIRIASAIFIAVPGAISSSIFFFSFFKCIKATDPSSIYRQTLGLGKIVKQHPIAYLLSTPVAVLNPRLAVFFLRPVPDSRLEKQILWVALVPVFLENIPQIVIQTYYLATSPATFFGICSLTISYLSMAHELGSVCMRISTIGRGRGISRRMSFAKTKSQPTLPKAEPEKKGQDLPETELALARERVAQLEKDLAKERSIVQLLRSTFAADGSTPMGDFS